MDRRSFVIGAAAAIACCGKKPPPRSYLQRVIDEYGCDESLLSSLTIKTPSHAELDIWAARTALYSRYDGMNMVAPDRVFLWLGKGTDPWGRSPARP